MNGKPDPIEAAIASADAVTMGQYPVTITSTGRPAMVALPVDATDGEVAELAGWLLTGLLAHFRAERAKTAGGRIHIVGRMPT